MSNALAWAAGIAGVGLIGYAIYFDHKRCSAVDYKQKIRQNRKLKQNALSVNINCVPDPRDQAAMEQYFLAEMVYGEELLREGELENGSIHMANAVFASGRANDMIQLLQQTLSPIHFEAVIEALPNAKAMFMASLCDHTQVVDASEDEEQGAFIIDEDLE